MVIWFLLKLVLNDVYIRGCKIIVLLFINWGWKDWIFSWCKVGVLFNNIGWFCIILKSNEIIKLFLFWMSCFVFKIVWVFFLKIRCWIKKGWKSLIVIFCGILYLCNWSCGLIIIMDCLE